MQKHIVELEASMQAIVTTIGEQLLIAPWRYFLNWKSDVSRTVFGVGGRWKMYRSLARDLVDGGSCFCIPLFSGMQTPVINAIQYLSKIRDYESIPRLKLLFGKYTPGLAAAQKEYRWRGHMVTHLCDPNEYVSQYIQAQIANALLMLLSPEEGKRFVKEIFSQANISDLSSETIRTLVVFARAHTMKEIASVLLKHGKNLRGVFDCEWQNFKTCGGSLSSDRLNGYVNLVHGAWSLTTGDAREEALQILVAEYNHLDSCRDSKLMQRPYTHIVRVMREIIAAPHGVSQEEHDRIASLFDQERLAIDLARGL